MKDWPALKGAFWSADGRGALIASVMSKATGVILYVDLNGNARLVLQTDPNVQVLWAIPSPDGRSAAPDFITGENNVSMIGNF